MRLAHPVLLTLLLLPACVGSPDAREPEPPVAVPERFSATGERPVAARWWTDFDDADLTALVEDALAGNLELRTTWDRLSQYEAIARRTGAARAVQLDGTLSADEGLSNVTNRSITSGELRVGLAARYELDLWGRLEARERAAWLDLAAEEEGLRTAAITLSALVANTWYELIEQRAQIDLVREQVQTNDQVLELMTLRFRQGKMASEDVLRQRQLVEATRANELKAEAALRVLENQLAVLLGRAPGTVTLPGARDFVPLPDLPDTGVPTELVSRRPDLRSAYQRVLAADQRVHEALADRYPRIALSASTSFLTTSLDDLFAVWFASVAADVMAPLLDGGEREAETARTRAVVSERLHEYGSVVLESLREVEDALIEESKQGEYIESLGIQLELSQTVVERLADRHAKGAVEYLDVLQALTSRQSLERSLLTARLQLLLIRVRLCRALAGGWEMERPEDFAFPEEEASVD
jgi:outer membrane protein, multidrug efflux system